MRVMVVAAMTMVVAVTPSVHDAAMILARRGAGWVVVGQGWRDGGGQEGRTQGGDQETLHSFFLRSEVTRTFGQGPSAWVPRLLRGAGTATKR